MGCFNFPQVFPVSNGGAPISEFPFTRTGLLGFIGPAGLIFVAGKMDGLMAVGGRRHSADDIVATALAVEPMKFVYRGRYGNAGSWCSTGSRQNKSVTCGCCLSG